VTTKMTRILSLAIGAIVAATLASCTSSTTSTAASTPPAGSPSVQTDGWNSYEKSPISFRYPPDWQAEELTYFSTMSTQLVYLSNQPMGKLCFHVEGGGSRCRTWPTRSLAEGGVVLRWTVNGRPSWDFSQVKGEMTTIDGHPSKVAIGDSPGVCDRIGGTPMTVTIDRDAVNNWYELDACFRDSPSTDFQTEIQSMLSTVRITAD
jgi:hypothetical protein